MCIYELNWFNLFNLNRLYFLYVVFVLCLPWQVSIKQVKVDWERWKQRREERKSEHITSRFSSLYLFILRKRSDIFISIILSAPSHLGKAYLSIGLISVKQIGDHIGDRLIVHGVFFLFHQHLVDFICLFSVIWICLSKISVFDCFFRESFGTNTLLVLA